MTELNTLISDTLAMMAILDRTEEDGDCLIWTGKVNEAGHPCLQSTTTRRRMWELACGPIPAGMLVSCDCDCQRCVNLEHLLLKTRSAVSRASLNRPHVKARRSASNARTNRVKLGKITMEIAREIRASDKTGKQFAAALGCSSALISLVRTGKSWRESANHWVGLGGRAA